MSKGMFWLCVAAAVGACLGFGGMAYSGARASWAATAWPIIAVLLAAVGRKQ
jgi:hypothetical protein